MDGLCTLKLHHAIPEFPSPAQGLVALPSLTRLSLHGDYLCCTSLLSHLDLSAPISRIMDFNLLPRTESPEYSDAISSLGQYATNSLNHLGYMQALTMQGTSTVDDPDNLVNLHLTCMARFYSKTSTVEFTTTMTLNIRCDEHPGGDTSWDIEQMLADYCLSMPIQGVRALKLDIDALVIEPHSYIYYFAAMKRLVLLEVSGVSTEGLPAALSTLVPKNLKATPNRDSHDPWGADQVTLDQELMFPALRNLVIKSYNFQIRPRCLAELRKALKMRTEFLARKALQKLTLPSCYFADAGWMNVVRQYVGSLEYDPDFLDPQEGDSEEEEDEGE